MRGEVTRFRSRASKPRMTSSCPLCGAPSTPVVLAEARWISDETVAEIAREHPGWTREDGACPACVQEALLSVLLRNGHDAFHESVQAHWPIDAGAAYGAIPTPLRLHADPRFTGRGVTIAFIDAGFFPHPDLTEP